MRQRLAPSAIVFVAMLLFAQWLGLAHRIEHGRPAQATQLAQVNLPALQGDSAGYDKALEHNCALFDGAALATALHSPSVSLAVLPGAKILALWTAFASWDAPVLLHFSSRAPPLA
ncbi:hypothetical protein [Janthinobacterium sp. 17J80-10]|uniref:hypothetical protein n=1 Tax=Janthinobacterium sp. 17J80-10 TaxID=2497863 RepID=UPI0010058D56|nr:hypothetical protein [Janthinobacterium sp. 17J80-10]QAU35372.1 hypothetical protein EKL02_14990 [Janthinobacterium sp. 17J80-10]